MNTVQTEMCGEVAVLTLDHGVTNAINPALVRDLAEALFQAKGQARGIVLCGGPKFFSIGLDLPVLIALDRAGMETFWRDFDRLVFDLATVPLPVVAVLSGHATAGGCILALTADYRFADNEVKKIGLNESRLGLAAPDLAQWLLRRSVGELRARDMLYGGEFLSFGQARDAGLIDAVGAPEALRAQALDQVNRLAGVSREAFADVKRDLTEGLHRQYASEREVRQARFLDGWFRAETQAGLRAAAAKF